MKKVLISIAGILIIAVVLVLFINSSRTDKTTPGCTDAAKVEVVKENSKTIKDACPETAGSEMSGCQQTCGAVATK